MEHWELLKTRHYLKSQFWPSRHWARGMNEVWLVLHSIQTSKQIIGSTFNTHGLMALKWKLEWVVSLSMVMLHSKEVKPSFSSQIRTPLMQECTTEAHWWLTMMERCLCSLVIFSTKIFLRIWTKHSAKFFESTSTALSQKTILITILSAVWTI